MGGFVTLYLKPQCVVGGYCGNFVKGAFASGYIPFKLTLLGIQGSTIQLYAEAQGSMYSGDSTVVTIERQGLNLRIVEKDGQRFILTIPRGCDMVIQENTSIGCWEHVP